MNVLGARDLRDLLRIALGPFCSRMLSPRAEERMARFIGDAGWVALRRQRRMITAGLEMAFGDDFTGAGLRKLTRKVFEHLSVDTLCFAPVRANLSACGVAIEGLQYLRAALSRGKGVILWESPFGNRMLGKLALMEKGFPLLQVHNQVHGGSSTWLGQKLFRKMYGKAEERLFVEVIHIQDDSLAYLRLLFNRLKENGIICMMALGPMGHKFVSVNFLGAKQNFATGAVNLARMSGASIVPIFCVTEANQRRVILAESIRFEEDGNRDEAVERAVSRYAVLLESFVRRYADHWHYWHKLPLANRRTSGCE